MKRTVIKIDEELCNGCGNCVEGCHEGALQLIDGKAVMVSDLYCDGLGACIGDCPVGAIELIEKETEAYSESAVMERIHTKGEAVILAHLKHLRDHDQLEWFNEGIEWCLKNGITLDLTKIAVGKPQPQAILEELEEQACDCPGSALSKTNIAFAPTNKQGNTISGASQLQQWPVQLHLLNPQAGFFKNADLLLASDCSAFSHGSFHSEFLKNKVLAIACPKLDSNIESYIEKLTAMIDLSKIDTLTVLMMEVPCCGGLIRIAKTAREKAHRNIPIKAIVISIKGEILSEEWI
ncbi:MAG: 4Fe-4S binding protein [Bacteroidales bacterium]